MDHSLALIIREMQIKTTIQHHLTPARMTLIQRLNIMLFGEGVEKWETLYTIGGNVS